MLKIKISFFLMATLLILGSCKKEEEKLDANNGNETNNEPLEEVIGSAPNEFDSKVVMEMFGGEWCDACPDGKVEMQRLMAQNTDDIYGVVVHSRDPFETINYNTLFAHLGGVGSFPSSAVNRLAAVNSGDQSDFPIITKQYWERNVNRLVNKKTNIGLAISSELGDSNCSIKVLVNGNNLDENKAYRLTVYVLENNVSSVSQVGKDKDYKHQMMLRGSLTEPLGESIILKNYETLTKSYSFPVSGRLYDVDNLEILAFVNTFGGNTSMRTIENAQKVKAGKTSNWD